jgi:hypothetical protein
LLLSGAADLLGIQADQQVRDHLRQRVLLILHSHRLAGKESVTLDDIAVEPVPRLPDADWNAYWRIDPRPAEPTAPGGPLVNAVEDKLELIAAGQAVAIVSAGLRADSLHPDLTIPLHGVELSHVVLATRIAAAWLRPSANAPRRASQALSLPGRKT